MQVVRGAKHGVLSKRGRSKLGHDDAAATSSLEMILITTLNQAERGRMSIATPPTMNFAVRFLCLSRFSDNYHRTFTTWMNANH